jgi:beta-aspartyl-peptidase (threonine type)
VQLIGSSNAVVGFADGMAVLMAGGSALDAVVATIRRVEANPEDHSVGYGGLPNLLGEVELDASIMDGATLATGAIAAMRGYQDAIDAARTVMETLPHVLIVGRGAEMLAQESGLPKSDLLTPEAREIWETRIDATDPYAVAMRDRAMRLTSDVERPLESHGTVNVIAQDAQGNMASGVSTSGWAWKYPGRVGDSPIIGAGNYADQRFGAAACTGRGEMAQRLCTAHSVVMFMRCGFMLEEALVRAAEDLHQLADPFWGEVNIVAMDREGRHGAVSTVPDKTYAAMNTTMSEPLLLERRFVPAP